MPIRTASASIEGATSLCGFPENKSVNAFDELRANAMIGLRGPLIPVATEIDPKNSKVQNIAKCFLCDRENQNVTINVAVAATVHIKSTDAGIEFAKKLNQ